MRTSLTRKAAAVVVLAVLLPTATARADIFTSAVPADGGGSAASAAASSPDSAWYGWQILAADLISLGALSFCFSARGGDNCALTLIPWVTGAAAIHWAGHGNPGRALVSVALHAGLPIAGGYLGYSLGRASCPDCSDEGNVSPLLGILMGTVLATVLDTAFSIESSPRAPARSRPSGPTLTPTIDGGGGGLGFGLAGSF